MTTSTSPTTITHLTMARDTGWGYHQSDLLSDLLGGAETREDRGRYTYLLASTATQQADIA